MIGISSTLIAATVAVWHCSVPPERLEPTYMNNLRLQISLHVEGTFDAIGTQSSGRRHPWFIHWAGNWVLLDKELIMIGEASFDIWQEGQKRSNTLHASMTGQAVDGIVLKINVAEGRTHHLMCMPVEER